MEKRYEEVYQFLSLDEYPSGYNKSQRFQLKKYASKFTIKEGNLFFGSKKAVQSKEDARRLFGEFHSPAMGGHRGIKKTQKEMSSKFYWHGMSQDIDKWVQECCQCRKVGNPLSAPQPSQGFKVSAVWELVALDLAGPFPITGDGFQYILTAMDYFSKWVEAFPLKSKSAAEVGSLICSMIYRHGCPQRILCDQGEEFVTQLNDRICSVLETERSVIVAYHPQTGDLDDKNNNNIRRSLAKMVNEKQSSWDVYLDATLFSLRSEIQTATKRSPFLLMYGREAIFS